MIFVFVCLFFNYSREVLNEYSNIDNGIGRPGWELCLWLLLVWVLVFLTIIKGVQSSGKAAYFLAIFPYIVIITLLGKAATLDGVKKGILFFIKPQWDELANPEVIFKLKVLL